MEYLNSVNDKLKTVDETNIIYIDLMTRPDLFYGTPQIVGETVEFMKYSRETSEEISNSKYNDLVRKEYESLKRASSGCRLRFKTNSKRLIFKMELNRQWDYRKINLWASSGVDIYTIDKNKKYVHKTVFGPKTGEKIFAESVNICATDEICCFLPLYNQIKKMYIGIENESILEKVEYTNPKPIVFYGNSITQGAAASRSGNCFPNIVSKTLDRDIINFSTSSCCRGLISVADTIGKLNCSSIVVDYTRNAIDVQELKKTHEKFYRRVRTWHPNIPIIIMTVSNFNCWENYYPYDQVVKTTYESAKKNGENTYLLNLQELFRKEEYDLISIDGVHFTDYGMYRVAERICEIIKEYE